MAQKTFWLSVTIFSLIQHRLRLQCSKPAPGHQREKQHIKHPPHLFLPSSKERRGHKGHGKNVLEEHNWAFSCSCVPTRILVRKIKWWQIWFLCRNYLEHFKWPWVTINRWFPRPCKNLIWFFGPNIKQRLALEISPKNENKCFYCKQGLQHFNVIAFDFHSGQLYLRDHQGRLWSRTTPGLFTTPR